MTLKNICAPGESDRIHRIKVDLKNPHPVNPVNPVLLPLAADKNALIKEFAKRFHAPIVCTLFILDS